MNLWVIIQLSGVHITCNSCGILSETIFSLKCFWGCCAKLVAVSRTEFDVKPKQLNIVCILLGISPASDCDLPTFRNPLSVPYSKYSVLNTQPLKMELTEVSETSANHNLPPGKYPKEYIQYSKHGESLKSRIKYGFHLQTVHLDIIYVFYSPTETQVNCLKNNFKIFTNPLNAKFNPICPLLTLFRAQHILHVSR
jgi:hypothetical protein